MAFKAHTRNKQDTPPHVLHMFCRHREAQNERHSLASAPTYQQRIKPHIQVARLREISPPARLMPQPPAVINVPTLPPASQAKVRREREKGRTREREITPLFSTPTRERDRPFWKPQETFAYCATQLRISPAKVNRGTSWKDASQSSLASQQLHL